MTAKLKSPRGITHVEDLDILTIIKSFRRLEEFVLTEKVDGSELYFGRDEIGFYTSRESKGDDRRYRNVEEYPIQFSTTYMRYAHVFLQEQFTGPLRKLLNVGDCIEVEVLYGQMPNVVEYDSRTSRVVLLRAISGNPYFPDIVSAYKPLSSIGLDIPLTDDGIGIYHKFENEHWELDTVRTKTIDVFSKIVRTKIDEILNRADSMLWASSGIDGYMNRAVLSTPLNKKPEGFTGDWHDLKRRLKDHKAHLTRYFLGTAILPIKDILIEKFISGETSRFGPYPSKGGWIEGVVFRNLLTNEQFKVIDKEKFLTIKDFAWEEREELMAPARKPDTARSFFAQTKVTMGRSLGCPELGTMQARKAIRDGVLDLDLINSDIDKIKAYWVEYIKERKYDLGHVLRSYNESVRHREILVSCQYGTKKVKYQGEIHRRTLQTFAVVHKKLLEMEINTLRAKSAEDLVEVIVPRRNGEIR